MAKPYDRDMTTLPLERFSWDPKTKELVAWESELRDHPFDGRYHWLQQMFSDACDVGIAIRSQHTDSVVRFCLSKELKNPDGETYGWEFKPYDQCRVTKVVIFND